MLYPWGLLLKGRAKGLVHLFLEVVSLVPERLPEPGENPEEGNPEEDQDSDQMDRVPLRSVFGQSLDKGKRKATTAVASPQAKAKKKSMTERYKGWKTFFMLKDTFQP